MVMFPSTRVQYISFNVRPQIGGKDNPLSNEKVRQALNYATNKDAIIQGPRKMYDPITAHDYLQQRIAANFAK